MSPALLNALKKDLTSTATLVRSAVVASLSGGAAAAFEIMSSPNYSDTLFTPAGIAKLKHSFLYGALFALVGLFVPSPLTHTLAAPASTEPK
jgi:hypothetical protein